MRRKKTTSGLLNKHHSAWLPCLGAVLLLSSRLLLAREFYFPSGSLEGGDVSSNSTDLSLFSNPKAQLPGKYPTRIRINGHAVDERPLMYLNGADGALEAQLTPALLRKWGVKVDDYPDLAALPEDSVLPQAIGTYIPAATLEFDFSTQTLSFSFPQTAVTQLAGGYIDPSRWDNGVPVMFSNYSFSGRENTGSGSSSGNDNSQYLNLRSGANLGGWRLRNYSTWNHGQNDNSWQTLATWVQHDIRSLRAQFVAGQSSTKGDVFDSIQYSGVNITSDEEMLPTSERGYAPVIRGTAISNAVVTVKQNGYIIYQSNVPPGPFEIRDLYATSATGDMDVTVKEADGTEHTFTQPSSSVALMQRPGYLKFESTVGRYRADNNSHDSEPLFAQGSAIYGVNNRVTLYGGVTAAENYLAAASGIGLNMGTFGSISADVTQAQTRPDEGKMKQGQSWRLLYTSSIEATNTQFTLASYRYSTSGYYSFEDANHLTHHEDQDNWSDSYNKRNRLQMSISQPFDNASFYVNGYQQDYWGTNKTERSVTAGGSYQFKWFSYHMNLSWNDTSDGNSDRIISLGVSIPLSRLLADSWVSYDLSNTKEGVTTQNIGLNGTLLEDRSLSYNLQQSHANQSTSNSSSFTTNWRTPFSNLNAGYYSASEGTRQLSYGASGAIVAHPHGVTLAEPLGDQFAIVDADGAAGMKFQNQYSIRTDWWGNAVIPSLSAYQENRIGVDTTSLPDDVDSNDTAVTVVPSRNAAVQAHFNAHTGYRVLLTLTLARGKPVPFGAMAITSDQQNSGIVDDQGLLYMAGLSDNTVIDVQWGTTSQEHCQAMVTFPPETLASTPGNIKLLTATCKQG